MPEDANDLKNDPRYGGLVTAFKLKLGELASGYVTSHFDTRLGAHLIQKELAAQAISAASQMLAINSLIAEKAGAHIDGVNKENEHLREANKNLFEELRKTKVRYAKAVDLCKGQLGHDPRRLEWLEEQLKEPQVEGGSKDQSAATS